MWETVKSSVVDKSQRFTVNLDRKAECLPLSISDVNNAGEMGYCFKLYISYRARNGKQHCVTCRCYKLVTSNMNERK